MPFPILAAFVFAFVFFVLFAFVVVFAGRSSQILCTFRVCLISASLRPNAQWQSCCSHLKGLGPLTSPPMFRIWASCLACLSVERCFLSSSSRLKPSAQMLQLKGVDMNGACFGLPLFGAGPVGCDGRGPCYDTETESGIDRSSRTSSSKPVVLDVSLL